MDHILSDTLHCNRMQISAHFICVKTSWYFVVTPKKGHSLVTGPPCRVPWGISTGTPVEFFEDLSIVPWQIAKKELWKNPARVQQWPSFSLHQQGSYQLVQNRFKVNEGGEPKSLFKIQAFSLTSYWTNLPENVSELNMIFCIFMSIVCLYLYIVFVCVCTFHASTQCS